MRKQTSVYKSVSDYVQELKRIRNPDKLIKIFESVPNNLKGEVILSLSKRKGMMLINALKDDEILTISHYLSPDEVTDLLQLISNRDRRSKLLKRLGRHIREKVDFLLKFDPRTAAGMMSLDYVEITPETTFDELAKITKRHEKRTGKIPVILVVKDGYLIGELPIHELVLHKGKERVGPYVHRVPVIRYDSDEDAVINTFRKHKHNNIPNTRSRIQLQHNKQQRRNNNNIQRQRTKNKNRKHKRPTHIRGLERPTKRFVPVHNNNAR